MVNVVATPGMVTTNATPSSPAKRKRGRSLEPSRADNESIKSHNAVAVAVADTDAGTDIAMADGVDITAHPDEPIAVDQSLNTRMQLHDMLSVLSPYDTTPSTLYYNIPPQPAQVLPDGLEPATKRPRTDLPPTIAARLKECVYDSTDELKSDIDHTSSLVLAHAQSDADTDFDKDLFYTRKCALLWAAQSAMLRVSGRAGRLDEAPQSSRTNGQLDPFGPPSTPANAVLTVLASARFPRPLFSSLQIGKTEQVQILPGVKSSVSVAMPISVSDLPPSVSITQLVPPKEISRRRVPVKPFGDLFKSSAKGPALNPPKPARTMSTRGNILKFASPESLSRYDRAAGYNWTRELQPTGRWLSYGGVPVSSELASVDAKRKQRDRALSITEVSSSKDEPPLERETDARADALFRSAFSSFAPSVDDLDAVIPAETKSEYWWYKYGKSRFENPGVRQESAKERDDPPASIDNVLDPLLLDSMLESFDLDEARRHEEEKEEEERQRISREADLSTKLDEISDMLQTLYSYQRIRHTTLSDSLQTMMGTPTTPAKAERDLYDVIKSRLAELVGTLPPYALAKLDGDQLQDLAVSTVIPIQTENQPGLLEEDAIARITRAIAQNAPSQHSSLPSSVMSGQINSRIPHHGAAAPFSPSSASYPTGTPAPARGQAGPAFGVAGSPMRGQQPGRAGPPMPAYQRNVAPTPPHPSTGPRPGYGTGPAPHRPPYPNQAPSPSPQMMQPPQRGPLMHQQQHQQHQQHQQQPLPNPGPLMNGHQGQYYSPVQQTPSLPSSAAGSQHGRASSPLKPGSSGVPHPHPHQQHQMPTSHPGHRHPVPMNGPVYPAGPGGGTPVHHHRPPITAPSPLPRHIQMNHPHPHQQVMPPGPGVQGYNIQPRPTGIPIQPAPSGPHPHQQHPHASPPGSMMGHIQPPHGVSPTGPPPPPPPPHLQHPTLYTNHPMSQSTSASLTPLSTGPIPTGSVSSLSVSSMGSQVQVPVGMPPQQQMGLLPGQAQLQPHQVQQQQQQQQQQVLPGGPAVPSLPPSGQRHPGHPHPGHPHPHFNGTSVPG